MFKIFIITVMIGSAHTSSDVETSYLPETYTNEKECVAVANQIMYHGSGSVSGRNDIRYITKANCIKL